MPAFVALWFTVGAAAVTERAAGVIVVLAMGAVVGVAAVGDADVIAHSAVVPARLALGAAVGIVAGAGTNCCRPSKGRAPPSSSPPTWGAPL